MKVARVLNRSLVEPITRQVWIGGWPLRLLNKTLQLIIQSQVAWMYGMLSTTSYFELLKLTDPIESIGGVTHQLTETELSFLESVNRMGSGQILRSDFHVLR